MTYPSHYRAAPLRDALLLSFRAFCRFPIFPINYGNRPRCACIIDSIANPGSLPRFLFPSPSAPFYFPRAQRIRGIPSASLAIRGIFRREAREKRGPRLSATESGNDRRHSSENQHRAARFIAANIFANILSPFRAVFISGPIGLYFERLPLKELTDGNRDDVRMLPAIPPFVRSTRNGAFALLSFVRFQAAKVQSVIADASCAKVCCALETQRLSSLPCRASPFSLRESAKRSGLARYRKSTRLAAGKRTLLSRERGRVPLNRGHRLRSTLDPRSSAIRRHSCAGRDRPPCPFPSGANRGAARRTGDTRCNPHLR